MDVTLFEPSQFTPFHLQYDVPVQPDGEMAAESLVMASLSSATAGERRQRRISKVGRNGRGHRSNIVDSERERRI